MKRPILICTALGALLFSGFVSSSAYAAEDRRHHRDSAERHQREHARNNDQHRRNDRQHRNDDHQRHVNNHRNERHHARNTHNNRHDRKSSQWYASKHHAYKKHKHKKQKHYDRHLGAKYFLGGLIVGSLAHPDHHVYSHSTHHGHRISYWMDSYGDCYRVEHRKRGKVYVEVPHYKCY